MRLKSEAAIGFLEEVLSAAQTLGTTKTTEVLLKAQNNQKRKWEFKCKRQLLLLIKKHYNVDEYELKEGRSQGIRVEALTAGCVFCYKHLAITERDIAYFLKKDYGNISKYIKQFNQLDVDNNFDKIIINKYLIFEQEMLKYTNLIGKKQNK